MTTTVSGATGITLSTNSVVKIGRCVSINVGITGDQLSNNAYTVIGTVASSYAPTADVTVPTVLSVSGAVGFFRIKTTGEVAIYKAGTATGQMYAYASYPV